LTLILKSILTNSILTISSSIRNLHSRSSINGFLKFCVGLLLNSLCILKFLDKLHFKHFHLHDFCLFLPYHFFFFSYLSLNFFPCCFMFLSSKLFNLCFLNSFLLLLELGLQFIFLSLLEHELIVSLFILLSNEFCLFGFLLFLKHHSIFDLFLFILSLLFHSQDFITCLHLFLILTLHNLHFLALLLFIFDL
jgi:hypothetical protein